MQTTQQKIQCRLTSFCFDFDVSGTLGDADALKDIDFVNMQKRCTDATKTQIKMEISASVKYMKLATHFAQDTINRPGFAKFFYAAASEEREHAYKLIEYLSMRGKYQDGNDVLGTFKIDQLVKDDLTANVVTVKSGAGNAVEDFVAPNLDTATSGLAALRNALKLEVLVTQSIRNLIEICETDKKDKKKTTDPESAFNHYHVSSLNLLHDSRNKILPSRTVRRLPHR